MEGVQSAKLYQTQATEVQHKYGKQLLDHVNITEGDIVGDIGCGCGYLAAVVSKIIGHTGKVIAIDPDLSRIKVARKEHSHLKNVSFNPCKSIHFPVDENKPYDWFISNAVLHWIPSNEKVITFQRIMSALKPGGLFVGNISFNKSVNMHVASSLLTDAEQDEINSFYYRENPEILENMLIDAGFEIIQFKYRYTEVNLGSVENFLKWISGTYYGKFDFKAAYKESKENVEFLTYDNGDLKHTSEGALFVVRKPGHSSHTM